MKKLPATTYSRDLTLYLVRHGDTAWAKTGQHTGVTDLPLLPSGIQQAKKLRKRLEPVAFEKVYSSPLLRARTTAELAGYTPILDPDLSEWNYGQYEGKTTEEIRKDHPGWSLFKDGAPGGETPDLVRARALRFLSTLKTGKIVLFSSAHILRVIATCWLGLPTEEARCFVLFPASLSILGFESGQPAILRWNDIGN